MSIVRNETREPDEPKETEPAPVGVTIVGSVRGGGSAGGAPAWRLREGRSRTPEKQRCDQRSDGKLASFCHRLTFAIQVCVAHLPTPPPARRSHS
jgi:hypothetical protein